MLKQIKRALDPSNKKRKGYEVQADQILELESKYASYSDEELQAMSATFRERLQSGETLDDICNEAFAVVREASSRVLKMKPFKVQVVGGLTLHFGDIAEMKTGEGKTLTSTMPAYLNALSGEGVHIVTVNDYLARRDSVEMGELFQWLGLTVSYNHADLDSNEKKEAYEADILYSTNNELGFDYLRDHMVTYEEDVVQKRGLSYCIIDEVDSILIDESRTPLIISGNPKETQNVYIQSDALVKRYKAEADYTYDLETKAVSLTDEGIQKAETFFHVDNIYDVENSNLLHHITQALKANVSMKLDVDYVVQDGEIMLVDQFTGRVQPGRAYSDGLHQAIEAKEGVTIRQETVTLATITYQNFFKLYSKISGMTGTAKTEEEEFRRIYGMDVVEIPTNQEVIRKDNTDLIFKTKATKYEHMLEEIKEKHEKGQPILIGTVAIETSEEISDILKKEKLPHEVLNAKNHAREAEIIMNAGQKGAITLATNMAGRGTDIKLGEGVRELGGLAIIGTERHESRRIDNQLRGRSGRQGDPGESRFYVSFEDELLARFVPERNLRMLADDTVLESRAVSRQVESTQKRVEGNNFDTRKRLLEYDDVLREQREIIYDLRRQILTSESVKEEIFEMLGICLERVIMRYASVDGMKITDEGYDEIIQFVNTNLTIEPIEKSLIEGKSSEEIIETVYEYLRLEYTEKEQQIEERIIREFEKAVLLRTIDSHWMQHIDAMQRLREGIQLRSYAQGNPLAEYRADGFQMFDEIVATIQLEASRLVMKARIADNVKREKVMNETKATGAEKTMKKERKKKERGSRGKGKRQGRRF